MERSLDQKRDQLRDAALESTTLRLAFIGLADGLLEALADEEPVTAPDLAASTDTDPEYVARWLDAAYGFELVQTETDSYGLTELGRSFLPDIPGTLMPLAVQSILSARMADRLSDLLVSGEQPGEEILGDFGNITDWFGPMLEAKFRPYFREHVLPTLDIFREVDAAGGRVLDLGCGNGWYLREVLATYENLTGVGVDSIGENIEQARRAAAAVGLDDRLEFHEQDLFEYHPHRGFDVVVLNRTLHHVWERRDDLFAMLEGVRADGSRLIIWEPAWPEMRDALRDPERRMLGMRNLAEHAMGNRLLVPDDIRGALESHGFEVDVHRLDAVETIFVARPSSGLHG